MKTQYSKSQLAALIFLRILIGWHFLYEGLIKLLDPIWTAEAYLMGSTGPFESIFQWLAGSLIDIVDTLNIAALTLVGLSLILGFKTKTFAYVGIALLVLYYLAYPPFPGWEISAPTEGSYFLINKNLIEAVALFVLVQFPTSTYFGLDNLFTRKVDKAAHTSN